MKPAFAEAYPINQATPASLGGGMTKLAFDAAGIPPDLFMPSQWADRYKNNSITGEERLLWACLHDAIINWIRAKHLIQDPRRQYKGNILLKESINWFYWPHEPAEWRLGGC